MKTLFIHLTELAERIDNSISTEVTFCFPAGINYDLFKDLTEYLIKDEAELDFGNISGPAPDSFNVSFYRYKLREELGIICSDSVEAYVAANLTNQILESVDPNTRLQKDVNTNLFIIGGKTYIGDEIRTNPDLWDANNSFMLYRWICLKADIPNNGIVYYLTHEPLELRGGRFLPSYICPLKTSYEEFNAYFTNSDEKRAMLKSQLFKHLCHLENPESRMKWLFSWTNFDTLFEKTKLAYDRYCLRYGEDRLAAQLEKESLDIIERVKGIGESLKAELIVLATNALAFSSIEFDASLTGRVLLIGISIVLINVVFQFVLCNGHKALADLHDLLSKRKELLLNHNPEQQHQEINKEFDRLEKKIESSKTQFVVASIILWLPLLAGLLIFCFWPAPPTKAIVDLSLKIFP
nr:hypothetical protein [uncultured Sphaerochaeta sp.]